jgi:hypothetical protein
MHPPPVITYSDECMKDEHNFLKNFKLEFEKVSVLTYKTVYSENIKVDETLFNAIRSDIECTPRAIIGILVGNFNLTEPNFSAENHRNLVNRIFELTNHELFKGLLIWSSLIPQTRETKTQAETFRKLNRDLELDSIKFKKVRYFDIYSFDLKRTGYGIDWQGWLEPFSWCKLTRLGEIVLAFLFAQVLKAGVVEVYFNVQTEILKGEIFTDPLREFLVDVGEIPDNE